MQCAGVSLSGSRTGWEWILVGKKQTEKSCRLTYGQRASQPHFIAKKGSEKHSKGESSSMEAGRQHHQKVLCSRTLEQRQGSSVTTCPAGARALNLGYLPRQDRQKLKAAKQARKNSGLGKELVFSQNIIPLYAHTQEDSYLRSLLSHSKSRKTATQK